jgi:hypothetical protein
VGLRWPRARRRLARGSGSLERGGDSPEGASGPRARRRLARGASGPRARQRIRGAAISPLAGRRLARGVLRSVVSWAAAASWVVGPSLVQGARGACFAACGFICLPFIIFRKGCFPRLLGDPYGCPRHLGPLLWWVPGPTTWWAPGTTRLVLHDT